MAPFFTSKLDMVSDCGLTRHRHRHRKNRERRPAVVTTTAVPVGSPTEGGIAGGGAINNPYYAVPADFHTNLSAGGGQGGTTYGPQGVTGYHQPGGTRYSQQDVPILP